MKKTIDIKSLLINEKNINFMKTESKLVYFDEFDYSDVKQAYEFAKCESVSNDIFSDYYHNMSYWVPIDIVNDKWKTINFMCNLLANDLPY